MSGSNANPTSARFQSSSDPIKTSAKRALKDREERRHSREDSLSERQFETLLRATNSMKQGQKLEARMALFLAGKLGLRGGEIAHLDSEWIDWQERVIEIPEHDTCNKGVNPGEVCGYCRQCAVKELKTNNLTFQEAIDAIHHEYSDERLSAMSDEDITSTAHRLRDEVNITYDEAISRRWKPKTEHSARQIPLISMCVLR